MKGDFNKGAALYYKGMGTVTLAEDGTAIGYTEPAGGLTDFYPYAGVRNSVSGGTVAAIGTESRLYTSAPGQSGASAGMCYIISSGLNPLSQTSYRANAYVARCVKEN